MEKNVIGGISYFNPLIDGDSAWFVASSIPATIRSNFTQPPVHVTIRDLRGKEKSVSLDKNGFELAEYSGSVQEEFAEDSELQKTYFQQISSLLEKRLGASRVIICHHAFRSRNLLLSDEQCSDTYRNPVFHPHVDADSLTAKEWVDDSIGTDESEKARKNRFQMINVWRPLGNNPIVNNPLAICDYSSIDITTDIHPLTIRRVDHVATAYTISQSKQNPHRWYYLSEMRSNEMFLFKNYDSKPDVARFAVHTAFHNDTVSPSQTEQKSIELRCLIFYDEQS